jgi:hypothetical protein
MIDVGRLESLLIRLNRLAAKKLARITDQVLVVVIWTGKKHLAEPLTPIFSDSLADAGTTQ